MTDSNQDVYLGVDVGTNSARCVAVTDDGSIVASHSEPITLKITNKGADGEGGSDGVFHEYSSEEIWQACCRCVQVVVSRLADEHVVQGLGFDATCSLVALGDNDVPVSVHPDVGAHPELNVICWMDHRAVNQAQRINATHHEVLQYVGGVISPEMECPKMLWLKEKLPGQFAKVKKFMDLADFLTYRATQVDVRSLCTIVCKWTFLGHKVEHSASKPVPAAPGWSADFFEQIGLGELAEHHDIIGTLVAPPGVKLGDGVCKHAADQLGITAGTSVAVSMIDAHAGGVGMIGATVGDHAPSPADMAHRLALICGTSSCHMAVSKDMLFTPGVWGPYYSAMLPGMWLAEGGQSATGSLLQHVIDSSSFCSQLEQQAEDRGTSCHTIVVDRILQLAKQRGLDSPSYLTKDLHVYPDFHGNRSPLADPTLTGMICGLTLSNTLDDLAILYLATIQAIAYGTRHIITELNKAGYKIDTIFACGGDAKNTLFLHEHANITRCRVVLPRDPSSTVAVGAAVLGACSSGKYESLYDAMARMNAVQDDVIQPDSSSRLHDYHLAKYSIFTRMYQDQRAYREAMKEFHK